MYLASLGLCHYSCIKAMVTVYFHYLNKPTCEELKSRFSLRSHYFDLAEEGERHAVGGLGERLDVPGGPRLGGSELSAGKGQHVEVRRAQLPVQLLQRAVVLLRLLALTRHVYNQRRLATIEQQYNNNNNKWWTPPTSTKLFITSMAFD